MPIRAEGDQDARRDLELLAGDLDDLPEAWREIGEADAAAAAGLAPHRSGRLAGTVEAVSFRGRAVVTAGSSTVAYAGPINYGWPSRHIRADLFLERAADQIEQQATARLEAEADKAINRRGFA